MRCVISFLFILWNCLLLSLLGTWCDYVSETIKSFYRNLEEDAVICEHNYFMRKLKAANHGEIVCDLNVNPFQHEIRIMSNEEILMRYTHVRERMSKRNGMLTRD